MSEAPGLRMRHGDIARGVERTIEQWCGDSTRGGEPAAQSDRAAMLRPGILARVSNVLEHRSPAVANRRWLCESVQAWAPLELMFPSRNYSTIPGVTGALAAHAEEIIVREYGHVLLATRDIASACAWLRADAQRLALAIEVGRALSPWLGDGHDPHRSWLDEFRARSLSMAEYLHRQAIGLSQVLSDSLVMSFTASIAQLQRELREHCAASGRSIVERIEA